MGYSIPEEEPEEGMVAGHYARHADEFDRNFCTAHDIKNPKLGMDTSDLAGMVAIDAAEAAYVVNGLGDRSPEAIARAQRLSRRAAEMAADANIALMRSKI
jgi:hypothetical protein